MDKLTGSEMFGCRI